VASTSGLAVFDAIREEANRDKTTRPYKKTSRRSADSAQSGKKNEKVRTNPNKTRKPPRQGRGGVDLFKI
jgi:hypothetical protein